MRLVLFIVCFCFLVPAFGQLHLTVKTPIGRTKEVFYPGDWFVFKLKDDDAIYRGAITSLDVKNNSILVETAHIDLANIAVVYSQKERRNGYSDKLITAGVMLPLIDHFNNSVIMDNEFSWNRGVLISSGALVVSGLAIKILRRRKYRVKGRFRLMFRL
ncbi:MAG: hypothetical protein AAF223_18810 [Bacteroidota bacterium]